MGFFSREGLRELLPNSTRLTKATSGSEWLIDSNNNRDDPLTSRYFTPRAADQQGDVSKLTLLPSHFLPQHNEVPCLDKGICILPRCFRVIGNLIELLKESDTARRKALRRSGKSILGR